jgi:hypothetical protein
VSRETGILEVHVGLPLNREVLRKIREPHSLGRECFIKVGG